MVHKAKLTIIVEFDSDEYDNPETMVQELVAESLYTIESTDNVTVLSTEFRDAELIK